MIVAVVIMSIHHDEAKKRKSRKKWRTNQRVMVRMDAVDFVGRCGKTRVLIRCSSLVAFVAVSFLPSSDARKTHATTVYSFSFPFGVSLLRVIGSKENASDEVSVCQMQSSKHTFSNGLAFISTE